MDTVRTWRNRFAALGLTGLADRKRSGRPPRFTALQVAQVKALACRLPFEADAPLSHWSCPELAREAMARDVTTFVSASTVRRWLAQDTLKPWQHRSWIFITDPDFRPKAERVLHLYARTFNGRPLGADEYVISADEKTSIQAHWRRPGWRPRPEWRGDLRVCRPGPRADGRLSEGMSAELSARSGAVLSHRDRGRAFMVRPLVGAGCCASSYARRRTRRRRTVRAGSGCDDRCGRGWRDRLAPGSARAVPDGDH
ncbi:helix-turn-helix domain-containing protein [Streptomyces sp. NBC_01352]